MGGSAIWPQTRLKQNNKLQKERKRYISSGEGQCEAKTLDSVTNFEGFLRFVKHICMVESFFAGIRHEEGSAWMQIGGWIVSIADISIFCRGSGIGRYCMSPSISSRTFASFQYFSPPQNRRSLKAETERGQHDRCVFA